MFGRLLKHQLKTTWKEFNFAYILIILMGFILALSIKLQNDVFFIVMIVLFVFSIFAVTALLLQYSVRLLYNSTYGKEAYLTFALPISTHSLIISKIVALLLYLLGLCIAILLSILTFFLVFEPKVVLDIFPALGDIQSNPWHGLIALICSAIYLLEGLICLQLVFAIAHSIPSIKKKAGIIILMLYAIGTIISIIEIFDPIDLYLLIDPVTRKMKFEIVKDVFLIESNMIFSFWSLMLQVIQLVGYYFLTIYLINKKLEIQ